LGKWHTHYRRRKRIERFAMTTDVKKKRGRDSIELPIPRTKKPLVRLIG